MELNIPCHLETDEIQELSNQLETASNISVEKLEEVAFSYLNSDAGKQEIKFISRILGLIESQDPSFFKRYLRVFLTQIKDPVFGVHFLCAFSNAIFTDYKSVIVSGEFWSLVQSSLTHDCSLTRKRGLYLAKRFTDDLQSFPVNNLPVENIFGGCLSKNNKIWEDYFLILECLEEKQVHIIQQILNRLQILQDFDASWGAIVFRRFFVHQNIIVVRWGVEQFFQYVHAKTATDANGINMCLLDIIVHELLETLNLTKLYSKEEGEHTGQTLAAQLSDCLNKLLATYKDQQTLIINSLVEGNSSCIILIS